MFTTHEIVIDTIQTGKKQIVNTFITDPKFKGELNKLIDAQTEFVKGSIKSSMAIVESMMTNAMLTQLQKSITGLMPTYTK